MYEIYVGPTDPMVNLENKSMRNVKKFISHVILYIYIYIYILCSIMSLRY